MNISNKLKLIDTDIKGKRCLVRVDYNVPLKHGDDEKSVRVLDPKRIVATIPTIKYLLKNGAKSIVLMSHLGRPKGKIVDKFSFENILSVIKKELGEEICFIKDIMFNNFKENVLNVVNNDENKDGKIFLLENLRFNPFEKLALEKDEQGVGNFRKLLTQLGDVYINDAFGTAHRAHSSMVGIGLKTKCAGFLLSKELDEFSKVLVKPAKPFLAILGGAKVTDKIQLIENLLDKVDEMIIGGGMAYTFKKVLDGVSIGNSLYDEEGAKIAKSLVEKAKAKDVKIHFPIDHVIGDAFSADAKVQVVDDEQGIPDGWMGLDVGPKTIKNLEEVILRSKTLIFNGPQGVFEYEAFSKGTNACMQAVAKATENGAVTIIGGGDTASASEKFGVADKVTHVSTGGGASLELLEGKELPGIVALSDK